MKQAKFIFKKFKSENKTMYKLIGFENVASTNELPKEYISSGAFPFFLKGNDKSISVNFIAEDNEPFHYRATLVTIFIGDVLDEIYFKKFERAVKNAGERLHKILSEETVIIEV
jgi:hypothetical protein